MERTVRRVATEDPQYPPQSPLVRRRMMRSTNIVFWTIVPIDPVLLVLKAMDEFKNSVTKE
jgi:hypothetical protein